MPATSITITAAQQSQLLAAAREAAGHAYAPYSGFRVGAALLVENGEMVTGANVENSSYSLSICAERSAVARAVSKHGPHIKIIAVAVTNINNASSSPCGACRQVLAEFMAPDGPILFLCDGTQQVRSIAELLPFGFHLTHAE